jgi:hypothetical protein
MYNQADLFFSCKCIKIFRPLGCIWLANSAAPQNAHFLPLIKSPKAGAKYLVGFYC